MGRNYLYGHITTHEEKCYGHLPTQTRKLQYAYAVLCKAYAFGMNYQKLNRLVAWKFGSGITKKDYKLLCENRRKDE